MWDEYDGKVGIISRAFMYKNGLPKPFLSCLQNYRLEHFSRILLPVNRPKKGLGRAFVPHYRTTV